MAWLRLRKFPWFSLCLILVTYSIFGWYIAFSSTAWSHFLVVYSESWGWFLKEEVISVVLHVLAGVVILGITTALTGPVAFITLFLGSWFQSDTRAFISVLAWSFVFVLIICWLGFFLRILLLVCAAILGRIALQEAGYKDWITYIFLSLSCLMGFVGGIVIFLVRDQGINLLNYL